MPVRAPPARHAARDQGSGAERVLGVPGARVHTLTCPISMGFGGLGSHQRGLSAQPAALCQLHNYNFAHNCRRRAIALSMELSMSTAWTCGGTTLGYNDSVLWWFAPLPPIVQSQLPHNGAPRTCCSDAAAGPALWSLCLPS